MNRDINTVYEEYLNLVKSLANRPNDKHVLTEIAEVFAELIDYIRMFLMD